MCHCVQMNSVLYSVRRRFSPTSTKTGILGLRSQVGGIDYFTAVCEWIIINQVLLIWFSENWRMCYSTQAYSALATPESEGMSSQTDCHAQTQQISHYTSVYRLAKQNCWDAWGTFNKDRLQHHSTSARTASQHFSKDRLQHHSIQQGQATASQQQGQATASQHFSKDRLEHHSISTRTG